MKETYDIKKLERQWLWYICASMLLTLMFVAAFTCFYQAFALMNENSRVNQISKPNASGTVTRSK
jgi:hypothetical protein